MPRSNAERQAAYRRRHLQAAEGQGLRLNVVVDVKAAARLERLARHWGLTQRAALELALLEAEQAAIERANGVDAYLDGPRG